MSDNLSPVYLAENTVLKGEKHTYTIIRYLGEGLTAVVYLAADEEGKQAAVKVLRSELSAMWRERKTNVTIDSFWNEPVVIGALRRAGVHNVPLVEDTQEKTEPYFIAMQFVDGKIFRSMEALTKDEPLGEAEALEFAWQALELLSKLHTIVKRTYTDMHLENFAWDRASKQLMVMDWNHVSPPRDLLEEPEDQGKRLEKLGVKSFEELVDKDLRRFATYLFQVLTGRAANENGEHAGALRLHAGSAWHKLSRALREVLVKALNPRADERFKNAASFCESLKEVLALWNLSPNELEDAIDQFKDLLQDAESARPEEKERLAGLDRAIALFDVLRQKQAWDAEIALRYAERLERLTGGVGSEWASGRKFFNAEQYSEAAKRWEPVAAARQELALWRWLMVARAGEQMRGEFTLELRKLVDELLEALDEPASPVLSLRIDNLRAALPNPIPSLQNLLEEGDARIKFKKAGEASSSEQPEDWLNAASELRKIARWLSTVTYGSLIEKEYGWQDLEEKANSLEARQERQRDLLKRQSDLRENLVTKFEVGLSALEKDLKVDTSLLEIGLSYARDPRNPLPNRLEVMRVCRYAILPEKRAAEVNTTFEQLQAEMNQQALQDALSRCDGEALVELISRVSAKKGFRSSPLFGATQTLLRDQFKLNIDQKRLAFATDVDQALRLLDDEGLEARQQILDRLQEQMIDSRKEIQKQLTQTTEQAKKENLCFLGVRFVGDFLNELSDKKKRIGPAGYQHLLEEVGEKINTFNEKFVKIKEERTYQELINRLETAHKELAREILDWSSAKEVCALIDQQVGTALQQVGQVTKKGCADAEESYQLATETLKKVDRHWLEYETKEAKVRTLKEILDFIKNNQMVEKVENAREWWEYIRWQINQLMYADSTGEAERFQADGQVHPYLSKPLTENWQAFTIYLEPLQEELDRREPVWRKALPDVKVFLPGFQDILTVKRALGGAQYPLSSPLSDRSTLSLPAGSRRGASGRNEIGSRGANALTWASFGLALLTLLAVLLGLISLGDMDKQLEKVAGAAAQTAVASMPTPAPMAIPQPTVTPTQTPVSKTNTPQVKTTVPPVVTTTVAPTIAAPALTWDFDYPAAKCVSKDKLYDLPPIKLPKDQGGGWSLVACKDTALGLCLSGGGKQLAATADLTGAAKEDWKALEGVKKAAPEVVEKVDYFMIYADPDVKPMNEGEYKLRVTFDGDTKPNTSAFKVNSLKSQVQVNNEYAYIRNEAFGTTIQALPGAKPSDYTRFEALGWAEDKLKNGSGYVVCVRFEGSRFNNLWVEGRNLKYVTDIVNLIKLADLPKLAIPKLEFPVAK